MTFNPLGAVQVHDFGQPKVISGKAREVISGGQLVFTSGTTGVVSSGLDTFAIGDIQFAAQASGAQFTGIALETVASGATVPVAVEGVFIMDCIGSVYAGEPIWTTGDDSIENLGSLALPASAEDGGMAERKIGRAITAGASGGYAVAYISL